MCGALAEWAGLQIDGEKLLTIAMNIEAQVINVPTGLQDYRPAYYGGVAAIELLPDGIKRVAIAVDPQDLQRRIVLAYTGAPHFSGTNNWEIMKRHIDGDRHVFDCFDRIVEAAGGVRDALSRGDWAGVADADQPRMGGTQETGTWRHDADDRDAHRWRIRGRRARRESVRSRRRRLSVLPGRSRGCARSAACAGSGGARFLDYRIETDGLRHSFH